MPRPCRLHARPHPRRCQPTRHDHRLAAKCCHGIVTESDGGQEEWMLPEVNDHRSRVRCRCFRCLHLTMMVTLGSSAV